MDTSQKEADFATQLQWYFDPLPDAELKQMRTFFKPLYLKKGDFLVQAGGRSGHLCFVQSGLLRMFAQTDQKEVTQWIASPGYFAVDLAGFAFRQPARLNIQALTDCSLLALSMADYAHMGEVLPRWHVIEKMFLMKCFAFLEERVFSHLSLSAEERYAHFFATHKELFNQVPLHYLASMLGMTPETFSRIRSKQLAEKS